VAVILRLRKGLPKLTVLSGKFFGTTLSFVPGHANNNFLRNAEFHGGKHHVQVISPFPIASTTNNGTERKGGAMNKFTFLLFMAATCMLGCKSILPRETIESEQTVPSPQPKAAPENIAWKSQKADSKDDAHRPIEQAWTAVAKVAHPEKRAPSLLAGKHKPAKSPEKTEKTEKAVVVEKEITAKQPEKVNLPGIPRDVWYAIATIFGAVFTSLLAPIAVEIIRERMALGKQQAAKQQNGEATT
jgi:hypothetical protein